MLTGGPLTSPLARAAWGLMKYLRDPKTSQCVSEPSVVSGSLRHVLNVFFKRGGSISGVGQRQLQKHEPVIFSMRQCMFRALFKDGPPRACLDKTKSINGPEVSFSFLMITSGTHCLLYT